jgi:hypothetical protein
LSTATPIYVFLLCILFNQKPGWIIIGCNI